MRASTFALVAVSCLQYAAAQSLPPSPINSVGCEAHDDHWHCDGPASSTVTAAVTTTSAASADSLITSVATTTGQCSAHGDHWHCPSGVSEPTTSPAASETGTHSDEHDDHDDDEDEHDDHSTGTGSLAPSPSESSGCSAHGDHWHCTGAATAAVTGSASNTTISSATITTTSAATSATSTPTIVADNAGSAEKMGKYAPLAALVGFLVL